MLKDVTISTLVPAYKGASCIDLTARYGRVCLVSVIFYPSDCWRRLWLRSSLAWVPASNGCLRANKQHPSRAGDDGITAGVRNRPPTAGPPPSALRPPPAVRCLPRPVCHPNTDRSTALSAQRRAVCSHGFSALSQSLVAAFGDLWGLLDCRCFRH